MKPPDRADLTASLRALLRGRVCIMGMGNRQRGDDGIGPRLIDARRPGVRGVWLDGGMAPENFLERIARTSPDAVLVVDAVAFGGSPGETRLLDASETEMVGVSTHAGSLRVLCDYLSARTGARVKLMAVQPERIDGQAGLSPAVEDSVLELAAILSDLLG